MQTQDIETGDCYAVAGYGGIAFRIIGFKTEEITCWHTGEVLDEVEDPDVVIAVMVGDDRRHEVDVSDLLPLAEGEFCSCCGQIGCPWGA